MTTVPAWNLRPPSSLGSGATAPFSLFAILTAHVRMPPFEWLARVGYAARGLVFLVLSYFTALAAMDAHTRPLDGKDALGQLLFRPLGTLILCFLAIGLLCFAAWRITQSYFDPDRLGADAKALVRRVVLAGAGLFYGAFATIVISMVFGKASSNGDRVVHDWTAWALARPFGRWVVGAIGLAVIAAGIGVCATGLRAEIRQLLELRKKKPRAIIVALGGFGSLTRGLVFAVIGAFLIFAAIDSRAHEATGLAGALLAIKEQTHGALLLGVTALGFLAFGMFGLAEAAFRRIDVDGAPGKPGWRRA